MMMDITCHNMALKLSPTSQVTMTIKLILSLFVKNGGNFAIEMIVTEMIYIKITEYYPYRYGVRVTTEECPVAVFVMSVQSIVGVIIQVSMRRSLSNSTECPRWKMPITFTAQGENHSIL